MLLSMAFTSQFEANETSCCFVNKNSILFGAFLFVTNKGALIML